MNVKLFFTNLIISCLGAFSLFLVFVKPFDMEIKYITVGVVFAIVLTGALVNVIYMMLKKKWVFWICFISVIALFLWMFRYELIGGYIQFYNGIMDMYSNYFESEMYFVLPSVKYELKANMTLMLYFSIVVVTCLYSVIIYRRKLLVIPIILNIFLSMGGI